MTVDTAVAIEARGLHYRELNSRIREEARQGATEILVTGLRGQRYVGAGLKGRVELVLEGVPGNDLACFMDGPRVVVRGNAQDGVANTMSSGEVVVHGDAGDVLAYGMRGGRVFVRGDVGYRVGIHMKEYRDRVPVVIAGGAAGDYFGEYMAGGTLVLLGMGRADERPLVGDFVGTGMHGGQMLVRGRLDDRQLGREVGRVELTDACWFELSRNLEDFAREFGLDSGVFTRRDFTRLMLVSRRPYGRIYVY